MADPGETELPDGAGTDLAPVVSAEEELRRHLPGLEPDRQVTDWGRSERVEGLVDRTLYQFLYHYWFRVEVEGVENVPREGGALLVANHAGAVPPDGAMIAKAIREEHPRPRPVSFVTQPRLRDVPGVGMLVTKIGGVADHPANLHRLLYDEGQLVLAFPEGAQGAGKPVSERYRLRPFEDAGLAPGRDHRRGADRPDRRRRLRGGGAGARPGPAPAAPARLAPVLPLPAKFAIRFLEPVFARRAWARRASGR